MSDKEYWMDIDQIECLEEIDRLAGELEEAKQLAVDWEYKHRWARPSSWESDMVRYYKAELEFYQKQEMKAHKDCDDLERQLSEAREREAGITEMYEELYEHHFKEHHTPDYVKIEELENQLAEIKGAEVCYNETISDLRESLDEARAEVEELKATIQPGCCGITICPGVAEARQEAARECMRVCDDLEDEGYHYETCCHLTVRDRIKAKFGLEG